ncbi:MAG: GTP-binding protein [Gemmatimonadales bacterium]
MNHHRPHIILMGGFLGAGKTAAMIALAHWLDDQGIRAGFITNDQGENLVDTRLMRACGFTTEEIPGGCFCCRFDDLVDATKRLRATMRPDVLVAEAVGSCTDLAATVTYPWRRLFSDDCTVAPLSVLVDPIRAQRAFGLEPGATFSANVQYIYQKQLEEADLIVVTKCELLEVSDLSALREQLAEEFPLAEIHAVSSRRGIGLDAWFRRIVFGQQVPRAAMTVDYDRYAAGEAQLGWLNATAAVRSATPVDGNLLLERLTGDLQQRLAAEASQIAHLKMTLATASGVGTINLARNDIVAELGVTLSDPVAEAELVVNLRAEGAPARLEAALRDAIRSATLESGAPIELIHVEAFRPGRPEPTHRDGVTPPST